MASSTSSHNHRWKCPLKLLILLLVLASINDFSANGLVHKTNFHSLYYTYPTKHADMHFLNKMRLKNPDLVFWNGIGGAAEKVYILCTEQIAAQYQPDFESAGLSLTLEYEFVEMTAIESNPDHPNDVSVGSRLSGEAKDSNENMKDPVERFLQEQRMGEDIEAKISKGETLDNQEEAEVLITKRKKKYYKSETSISEIVRVNPQTPGLLAVEPLKSNDGMKDLPVNSGLLYRIQGIQTLFQHTQTSINEGEWITHDRLTGERSGSIPRVGEFLKASVKKRRIGTNPYITAEETDDWKNLEYKEHVNKSVLWMFVPTEFEKYYEIRSRNYPFSLLVWNYDLEEGEFILSLETRREFLKRYKPDGVLRHRALYSLQMVDETFEWELRDKRPKFYITTKTSDRVYLFESKRKDCSVLVVRNSAVNPYQPDKTDKISRPLDMFYITRTDLTGRFTASIFSFMYKKSIVDIFAASEQQENVKEISTYELTNRRPVDSTQHIFESVLMMNQFNFEFNSSFDGFMWVTLEAPVPSFGVSPMVNTGVVGPSTSTSVITREFVRLHEVQDKVVLDDGYYMNGSVIFQGIQDFENHFTALMEITAPADRMYYDRNGNPRFFRLSLPGRLIEHMWKNKTNFQYDRVIEKRESAFVVQVSGTSIASYGLRAFVKKSLGEYGIGISSCPHSKTN